MNYREINIYNYSPKQLNIMFLHWDRSVNNVYMETI